jgi:hypothetical protein
MSGKKFLELEVERLKAEVDALRKELNYHRIRPRMMSEGRLFPEEYSRRGISLARKA